MGERRIKVGICGVGHLGSQHARVFNELEDSELIGVYDPDPGRGLSVADQWGTRSFERFEELLEGVEAVSCVAPTEFHYSMGIQILEAQKHLFLEKPMTQTAIQARELLREAGERRVKLQVGHIERFNPAFVAVENLLGDPKFIEVHRLSVYNPRGTDVDVVLDLMIHDLDLIRNRLKGPPVRVEAVGIPVITDKVDIANARLEFEDGAIANVTASRVSAEKMRKIRMFQRDAYISVDCLNRDAEVYTKRGELISKVDVDVKRETEPLKAELHSFLRAILEDREPVVTGEDGYRALELALEIQRTMKERMDRVGDL
jgi:predicted dehydrogenase